MGQDLARTYLQARLVYEQADAILGFPLSNMCFSGPQESLDDTSNTQPALFVTSLAALEVLKAEVGAFRPAMVAGHSLGELTALVAAGAMSFVDGLKLVGSRGRLMKLAGQERPGGMAAVLKMDDEDVEKACRQAGEETGKPVQVANYNSPGQVVISGDKAALARAIELLRERGAKRIVPLAVSIAAHSALMSAVAAEYRAAVETTPCCVPDFPVIGNVSARPLVSVADIRDELAGQLTWPVRWTTSVQWMVEQGVTHFIEVGPKDVLTRLVQRIDSAAEALSAGTVAAIAALTGSPVFDTGQP